MLRGYALISSAYSIWGVICGEDVGWGEARTPDLNKITMFCQHDKPLKSKSYTQATA